MLDLKAQYAVIRNEVKAVVDKLLEEQAFILGEPVKRLEEEIARYSQTRFGVGVASGSDALYLALYALGVGCGDEVITTPYTFFATAGAISRLGAVPVFVDIDPLTYNINPALIQAAITPRSKAIIPVHLYGQCADMAAIMEIARKAGLAVVEDAAQAIGAEYGGQQAGSMGDLGCFSFFPSKNLGGIGDAGMVVTNQKELAEKIRLLRVHGGGGSYHHQLIGVNSRLDAIQAAVLLVKLKYLPQWSQMRRENAERYQRLFQQAGLSNKVQPPLEAEGNKH
ncbi:MAG: DegT/DnrJ/EryC1/StrS family aminotransferase, partial [Dehalococcoidales bacterium]